MNGMSPMSGVIHWGLLVLVTALDPGRAYFVAHNAIEVCVTMPVANPHYGDQNMKN
jgi:hypothetical protein